MHNMVSAYLLSQAQDLIFEYMHFLKLNTAFSRKLEIVFIAERIGVPVQIANL
jgi:hypothetical protein